MIRAVIFDCFGVIITDALQVALEEVGAQDPAAAQQVRDIIHANNRGLIEPVESNKQIAEILGVTVAEWRHKIDDGEVKDERLLAYIRSLRKKYRTALLSNIGAQSLRRRFADDELRLCFDVVVASGELGIMKPDPEIYQHAAKELGVPPAECVMIDDRDGHCDGARAVGMQAIVYQDFVQMKRELELLLARA